MGGETNHIEYGDKVENIRAEIDYVIGKLKFQQKADPPFTDRELKELELAITYARHFAHGTTGHNQLMLISNMFEYLSRALSDATEKWAITEHIPGRFKRG